MQKTHRTVRGQDMTEISAASAGAVKKDMPEPDEYGPAMLALSPLRRKFVLAYVMFANCDATAAARMAGYKFHPGGFRENGSIRGTAHSLVHSPAVGAAIRELALACAGAEAPIYLKTLAKIATNDEHKDQVKALGMMLNRVGLPETVSRDVNVNITVTTEQKVIEIRQMAAELGLDPQVLLGNVSDAKYTDVSTETGDE